jgi:7-cyano-7-deazaguanine synthase
VTATVLLLSGGLDSAALAAATRPTTCLTIDYGQRPADAERTAAQHLCADLELEHATVRVDCSAIGGGLLAGTELDSAPSPEWWPFRNQLLVTIAAAWAHNNGHDVVVAGSVRTDGERHRDGASAFYELLDEVVAFQEGAIRVAVPGITKTTEELIEASGIPLRSLAWTHSCHVANLSCGLCPGCEKRTRVLAAFGCA